MPISKTGRPASSFGTASISLLRRIFPVDIDAAVARALEQRSDLRQSRFQREISSLNLEVTDNNTRPDLNLTAAYSVQ